MNARLKCCLLPFALYAAIMLLTNPDVFLFDLGFTLTRVSGLTLIDQLQNLALNYTTLLWILAGVIGLFLLLNLRQLSLISAADLAILHLILLRTGRCL